MKRIGDAIELPSLDDQACYGVYDGAVKDEDEHPSWIQKCCCNSPHGRWWGVDGRLCDFNWWSETDGAVKHLMWAANVSSRSMTRRSIIAADNWTSMPPHCTEWQFAVSSYTRVARRMSCRCTVLSDCWTSIVSNWPMHDTAAEALWQVPSDDTQISSCMMTLV